MSVATRRALYGKMAGDSTLTNLLASAAPGYTKAIYYQQAPSEARFPYVIFNKQSGVPSYGMTSTTVIDEEIWLIKGVDRGADSDVVDAISSRLNALLTDGTVSVSGKTQLYLRREGADVDYSENVDGMEYKHAGSSFRLIVV